MEALFVSLALNIEHLLSTSNVAVALKGPLVLRPALKIYLVFNKSTPCKEPIEDFLC